MVLILGVEVTKISLLFVSPALSQAKIEGRLLMVTMGGGGGRKSIEGLGQVQHMETTFQLPKLTKDDYAGC